MGPIATQRAAVMSIHPKYARAIMSGDKTVEFRKRRLAADVTTVWVYATSPVRRIIGSFEIAETIETAPSILWKMFGDSGHISQEDFLSYFASNRTGVALRIGSVTALREPVHLNTIVSSGVPPQSFVYIQTPAVLHCHQT